MQFAGWGISAAFLPRTADLYGRRRVYILSMIGLSTFLVCIMLSPNLILTLVLMFLFGTMSVGRAAVGYLFMQEFIPAKNQAVAGTISQCFDSFSGVIATLYFYYISSDCRWIQLFGILCAVVSILGAIFILPESPKYLHCQKRWTDLRKVLTYIGKVNGKTEPFTGTFDREVPSRRFNYINDASRATTSTIADVELLKTP
jgi:MFS family permease